MASIDEDIIAALRARVAGLERHAGLLRDSRARVCGTLTSIHAALDGRPASEGEPDVVRRAARVVAELAAERARAGADRARVHAGTGRGVSGEQETTDPSVRCRCGKRIALDVYHTDHGAYDGIVVEETCPRCGRVLSIETRIRFVVVAVAPPK